MDYRQVFIKSEEDLPKGNDAYLSHSTSGHVGFRRCVPTKKEDHATFENISGEWWMKHIDWYLLPIESPELPTDEEIESNANEFSNSYPVTSSMAAYFGYKAGAKWMRDGKIQSITKEK
jgi:hypothetical protein